MRRFISYSRSVRIFARGGKRCCENYHRLSFLCCQPKSPPTYSMWTTVITRGGSAGGLVANKPLCHSMLNLDRHQSSQLLLKTQIYLLRPHWRTQLKSVSSAWAFCPLAWLRQKTGIVATTAGVPVILLHSAHLCSPTLPHCSLMLLLQSSHLLSIIDLLNLGWVFACKEAET